MRIPFLTLNGADLKSSTLISPGPAGCRLLKETVCPGLKLSALRSSIKITFTEK